MQFINQMHWNSDLFELCTLVPFDIQIFTISENDHVEDHISFDKF